jgi:serine/threonine protein kinase
VTQTIPPASPTFDEYVFRLVDQSAGRAGVTARTAYDRWAERAGDRGSFLDYLTAAGVLDRVGARAVVNAWRGELDVRDARQLLDAGAVARRIGRLTPVSDQTSADPGVVLRAVGTRIGRFTVKGVLGWGGFGPVYLANHPTLRVPVALKMGGAADPDRLRAEARRQATVNHPNVVRVWDLEEADEPVLVLEYVPGENLAQRIADGPVAPAEAFTALTHAARGLRAAWKAGVAHGDVKPANLLATPDGGVKVADFGLARCRRGMVRAVTADTPPPAPVVRGTWLYAAPEQFENGHDFRADMYSLGLTVYHALAGVPAVAPGDPDSVMLRHKRGGLDPVHVHAPAVGRRVSDLIGKMTAVDPDRRFTSYDELLDAAAAAFGLRLETY